MRVWVEVCPLEFVVMSRNGDSLVGRFLTLVIVGSSLAAVAGCSESSTTAEAAPETTAAAPVIDVPVVRAVVGDVESSLEISGTLTPRTRVAVKPRLPGTLEQILVDIGDAVREGQTIATLDRREIDAQADAAVAAVAVAKASLDTAEAALANAVLEHDRAKNLFDRGALPRQRLEGADTAHRASVAQRDLATANRSEERRVGKEGRSRGAAER